jgi:hypothetical protein
MPHPLSVHQLQSFLNRDPGTQSSEDDLNEAAERVIGVVSSVLKQTFLVHNHRPFVEHLHLLQSYNK